MMDDIYRIIQDVAGEWHKPLPPDEASQIMSDINTYKRDMRVAFERLVTSGIRHDGVYAVYKHLMEILDLLYYELEIEFIMGMEPDDYLPANREYVRLVDLEW